MKKKLLLFALATSLCGCGEKAAETTTEQTTSVTTEQTTVTTTEEVTTKEQTTEVTTEKVKEKTFDGLCEYLEGKDILQGEKSEAMYAMINAINGCKYLECNVELYEYDINSDAYKDVLDTNKVVGIDCYINGPYVLFFDNGATDQAIIDAFNTF